MQQVKLEDYKKIVFFTGAGISAESGIPTYRGEGGLWHEYNYEEYACQDAFDSNPAKVWEFHDTRRDFVAKCDPNIGHERIAKLEQQSNNVTIVTQNIDGLHQRAGSRNVFELHGSLWRVRCDSCGVVEENLTTPLGEYQHSCGNDWRPDIVWFGDSLHQEVLRHAIEAVEACDLFVSVGTSGAVFPAAHLPYMAKQNNATLLEINPEETPLTPLYDCSLRRKASEILPMIIR